MTMGPRVNSPAPRKDRSKKQSLKTIHTLQCTWAITSITCMKAMSTARTITHDPISPLDWLSLKTGASPRTETQILPPCWIVETFDKKLMIWAFSQTQAVHPIPEVYGEDPARTTKPMLIQETHGAGPIMTPLLRKCGHKR